MAKRKQQPIPQTLPKPRVGVTVRVALPDGSHMALDFPNVTGWGLAGSTDVLALSTNNETVAVIKSWISIEWAPSRG